MLLKTFKFWSIEILCNTRSLSLPVLSLVPCSRALPAVPGFMRTSWAMLPLTQHCAALWQSLCLEMLQLLGFWRFLLPRINRIRHVPLRADLAPLPYHVCSGGVEFCSWILHNIGGWASLSTGKCFTCTSWVPPLSWKDSPFQEPLFLCWIQQSHLQSWSWTLPLLSDRGGSCVFCYRSSGDKITR